MPTVPLTFSVPRVESVPVTRLIVATPPPRATSAAILLIDRPDDESMKRAPDVLTDPLMSGFEAGPRTEISTLAAPLSDRPICDSLAARKLNGTPPETSIARFGVPAVVTVPSAFRFMPEPSVALAVKSSLLAAKVPDEVTPMPPKPALRVGASAMPVPLMS